MFCRPLLLLTLALAGCTSKPPETKAPPTQPTAAAAPAGPAALDEGTLRITAGGKPAGEETFKLVADGEQRRLTTTTVLRQGDAEARIEGTLGYDASFHPVEGTFKHSLGDEKREAKLERKDGKLSLQVGDGTPLVEKQPSALFINNLIVSHLAALCHLATDAEREIQLFPDVTLTVSGRRPLEFTMKAGAKQLDVIAFRVPGGQLVELFCDKDKLVMVRQPSSAVISTRVGYEEVAEIITEAEDHKPKLPVGLVELERSVRAPADGGALLSCSLLLPADRRSPLPSVVFFSGSGNKDRDGDTIGPGGVKASLLKNLAIALATSGVASLRCDDRGVGKSTGAPTGSSLGALVADGAAQIAVLRSEPGLDALRIGLVGHSEGTTIAELLAASDSQVRALVLLSAMGRTLDQVSLDERDAQMRKIGVKEDVIRVERKRFAAIYDAIRVGKPVPADTPDETRAALAPLVAFLASHFRVDLAYTAKKIKVPVLLASGEKDTHVPAKDAKLLRDLLSRGGNGKVTLKLYPDLSHVFAQVKTGGAEDYADPELTVDLAFVGDVVSFLGRTL